MSRPSSGSSSSTGSRPTARPGASPRGARGPVSSGAGNDGDAAIVVADLVKHYGHVAAVRGLALGGAGRAAISAIRWAHSVRTRASSSDNSFAVISLPSD